MHAGQIMFAQVMNHLPLHQFRAIVKLYSGDYHVRSFPCLDQFYTMAFAQLTYRESLRDIETCLLRDPRQGDDAGLLPTLFTAHRQGHRASLRPNHCPDRAAYRPAIPGTVTARRLLRRRNRQAPGIPDKQLCRGTTGRGPVVSLQMERRVVLQVGQAAFAHQGVLWHFGERGQDAIVDCHCIVCARCDSQEASGHRRLAPHNSTDCERQHFRENPDFTGDCSGKSRGHAYTTMQPVGIV